MTIKRILARGAALCLLAAALAASLGALAGCGGEGEGVAASPVPLMITSATMPETAAAGTPVAYEAVVRLTNTRQVFSAFTSGRSGDPFSITAYGQSLGGGVREDRTERHRGTITFPRAGVYTVIFLYSDPLLTRTVVVS